MLKQLLAIFLSLSVAAWSHEAYYLQLVTARGTYALEQEQLGACGWYLHRGERLEAFYFRAPDGVQLVLTYPKTADYRRRVKGRLRLVRPGQPALCQTVSYCVRVTGAYLSLEYEGRGVSGEVWLDTTWKDVY
ncbi:MAG: hypothetical protein U0931_31205 [Vulcanimicrobiota bacterium]